MRLRKPSTSSIAIKLGKNPSGSSLQGKRGRMEGETGITVAKKEDSEATSRGSQILAKGSKETKSGAEEEDVEVIEMAAEEGFEMMI